jgi:hypothetical protein
MPLQTLIERGTEQRQPSLESIRVQLIVLIRTNEEMMLHVIPTHSNLPSQGGLQMTSAEICTVTFNVRSRTLMAITEAIQIGLTSLSRGIEIATSTLGRQIINLLGMQLPLGTQLPLGMQLPLGTRLLQGTQHLQGTLFLQEITSNHPEVQSLRGV